MFGKNGCGFLAATTLLGFVGLSSAANDVAHFTPLKQVKNVFGGVTVDGTTSLYYSAGDRNEIYNVTQTNGAWGDEAVLSADGTTNLASVGAAVYKSTTLGDPYGVAVLADKKVTMYGIDSTGSKFASKVWGAFSLDASSAATDIAVVSATAGDMLLGITADCKAEIYLLTVSDTTITATEGTAPTLNAGLSSCSSISAIMDTATAGWIFLTGNTGTTVPLYGTFAVADGAPTFTENTSAYLPLLERDFAFGSGIVSDGTSSAKLFGSALDSTVMSGADYNVAFTSPFDLATGGLSAKLSPTVSGTSTLPFAETTTLAADDCAVSVSLGNTDSFYAQLAFAVDTAGGYNATFVSADETETLSFVYTYASSAGKMQIDRTTVVGTLLTPSVITSETITTTKTGDFNIIVDRHFAEFDAEAGGLFGAVAISRTNPFTKMCLQAADATNAVSVLSTSKVTSITSSNPNGASAVLKTLSGIGASLGLAAAAALLL